MAAKIAAFIEAPNSGGNYRKVFLVVHVTVSPETNGAARGIVDFWNRGRTGSTQYVVDNREIIQGVRETAYAWAAGTTANKWGIHVEHCGFIQSVRQWKDGYSTAELDLSAPLFAELAAKYGIPIRRLTVEQIRHAVKTGNPADGGICGHSDITAAFPGETTHTDPGAFFPWDTFIGNVRAAAAKPKPAPAPKPAPKPKPAKKKTIRLIGDLTIAHGNLFKDNQQKAEDVSLIDRTKGVHVFGLNEAYRFRELLATVTNYRVVQPAGSAGNNAILLRNDVAYLGDGSRKMCEKVGSSPQRDATWVLYGLAGLKWAHIQTHANAHIEANGTPRVLPRVTQDIAHMGNLTALVKELRAQGYRVTVAGDLNWHWKLGPVWTWAPRAVFARLGLRSNWMAPTAPTGGSLGSRRIDYLAHSAEDLRIAGQRIITGEHSDHRWLAVSYKVVA